MGRKELAYKAVRDYLNTNPGADIFAVCDATGVPFSYIVNLVRDEHLMIAGNHANSLIRCEICHIAINTGRLCKKCSKLPAARKIQSGRFYTRDSEDAKK